METQQRRTRSDGHGSEPEGGRRHPGRKTVAFVIAGILAIGGVACDGSGTGPRVDPKEENPPSAGVASPDPIASVTEMGPPGRYAFATGFHESVDVPYQISFEIPAGYDPVFANAAFKKGMTETGVSLLAIGDVYADACSWEGASVQEVSSTEDVVAALASQRGLRVSTPADVTLGGIGATYMERKVPADTDPSRCDGGEFRVYTGRDGGARFIDNPGQLDLLWVLDLDGVPVVIDASLEAGISAEDRAEVEQIVASVQIDPI
jgi:hypothetical protein